MGIIFHLFTFAAIILAASTLHAETTGIRGGTEAFRQGEFERAAEAFAEAEKRDTDDPRIVFNHGAALFAAGKPDEAVETLRRSATSKDPVVAAKSLSLLGRISVDRARQSLAPAPEEIFAEQRQTVLDHLAAAERHYSEALAVRPNEEIRRNLEEIRAWRSRMTETWENVDQAQKRSDDMAQRLQWLEEWQEKLHDTVRETAETEDSPKKFQDFYESAREQNRIAQEIGTAKDELQQILAENQEADPNHPVLRELDLLRQQAESAEQTLRNFKGEEASELARETARRINRLRMNLAPFEAIVQEAEKRQTKLCETNRNPSEVPPAVQARDQSTVGDWMPLMIHRAEQGLEQLGGRNSEDESSAPPPSPTPQQTEALRKSMELAVQHGPEIRELAVDAAERLSENKSAEALPKQDRALELLRKILEPLRQQQQQNQQDQRQQDRNDQQQQQNESQQSGEQENKKEENPQNEQQRNEQQQNQAEQNEPKPEPKEQEDKRKESEAKEQKAEQDERQEKAERMLRQVRRRQQEATEKRERIRTLLLQLEPVEKDW